MDGWMLVWMDAGMKKWTHERNKEQLKKLAWVLEMSLSLNP